MRQSGDDVMISEMYGRRGNEIMVYVSADFSKAFSGKQVHVRHARGRGYAAF